MHNVEFKAELRDPTVARFLCRTRGATHIVTVGQTDTYFRIPQGRLKKREVPGEPTEYIFYDRADRSNPKLSHFTIYPEAAAIERFGATPLPVWIVVRKEREIFMTGNVRIHLDRVDHLGAFLEFEALVSRDHNVAACHHAIAELRSAFAHVLGEPIACSYSDLLAQDHEGRPFAPPEEPGPPGCTGPRP